MASFRATLNMGGKKFDVHACSYEMSRNMDAKGNVASNINGGRVTLTIESTEDTSVIEAMVNSQFKPFDLDVTFMKPDDESEMKKLTCENCYVVYYKEALDIHNENPMLITFTASAKKLKIGGAELENSWMA